MIADFQPVGDMIHLSELNEESVLMNLQKRFEQKLIYVLSESGVV